MKPPVITQGQRIVDESGKLTLYGYDLLKRLADLIEAQEVITTDHEARLVAGGL